MRIACWVTTILIFVASVESAQASVGVSPDPDRPGVVVDSERRYGGNSGTGSSGSNSGSDSDSDSATDWEALEREHGQYFEYITDLPQQIMREVRRMALPRIAAQTQPASETIVNIDTIFYARANTFTRSVTLLGHGVDIRATPTRFRWQHGDGTSQTTTTAGRKYPNQTVTHRYRKARKSTSVRVDVTYGVEFRINGGPWVRLAETITAQGPTRTITVKQATALLTRR